MSREWLPSLYHAVPFWCCGLNPEPHTPLSGNFTTELHSWAHWWVLLIALVWCGVYVCLCLCVFLCESICVSLCVYMYVCVSVCAYVSLCVSVCACVSLCMSVYMCICVCVYVCLSLSVSTEQSVWRSQGQRTTCRNSFSFYHPGFRNWTQDIMLGSRAHYPLCHLSSSCVFKP